MKTKMQNHTNCLQILEHTICNITKLQSNMQGYSTSNEQSFGKTTSQERYKDSGFFFPVITYVLLILYMQIKCSYK